MSSLPFAALADSSGFVTDPRFAMAGRPLAAPAADPVAQAWQEGYSAGRAEAEAEALADQAIDNTARAAIELSLVRLDADLAEQLRLRLNETVAALCNAAIAPFAIDASALSDRVARAAAMLARADDDRVLRLHPDDHALIADRLPMDLTVLPDSTLERGALRIEGASGGVEDGPAQWRRAIAEALAQC